MFYLAHLTPPVHNQWPGFTNRAGWNTCGIHREHIRVHGSWMGYGEPSPTMLGMYNRWFSRPPGVLSGRGLAVGITRMFPYSDFVTPIY